MKKKLKITDAVKLIVTGVDTKNKRFRPMQYTNDIAGRMTAYGINLYRGSIWGISKEGQKFLLRRVYN